MQVYLPEELHHQVKDRKLPVSELLQRALQTEIRRLDLLAATDRYVAALIDDVGVPTGAERKRAADIARRIARRPARKAG